MEPSCPDPESSTVERRLPQSPRRRRPQRSVAAPQHAATLVGPSSSDRPDPSGSGREAAATSPRPSSPARAARAPRVRAPELCFTRRPCSATGSTPPELCFSARPCSAPLAASVPLLPASPLLLAMAERSCDRQHLEGKKRGPTLKGAKEEGKLSGVSGFGGSRGRRESVGIWRERRKERDAPVTADACRVRNGSGGTGAILLLVSAANYPSVFSFLASFLLLRPSKSVTLCL